MEKSKETKQISVFIECPSSLRKNNKIRFNNTPYPLKDSCSFKKDIELKSGETDEVDLFICCDDAYSNDGYVWRSFYHRMFPFEDSKIYFIQIPKEFNFTVKEIDENELAELIANNAVKE